MTKSTLLHHNARTALAARDILSFTPGGAIVALILASLLAVGMFTGSPSAVAQDTSAAVTPAVASAAAQKHAGFH